LRLGELLLIATKQPVPTGNTPGICVVCCNETEKGIPVKKCVSENFSGWNMFYAGDCMCPECAFLFSDQTFRRKSWVASDIEFRTFKNDEACNILFSPPEPPFFIHIAKQGQRQTWLSCLHRVAYNRTWYFFSHEGYDVPILFERGKAEIFLNQAKKALELGITKGEIVTGTFKMKTWKKAYQQGWQGFLKELEKNKGSILWEVIVDVARR